MSGTELPKISDEMVEIQARAVYALDTADTLLPEWDRSHEQVREVYREEAQKHLTALVASGYRREVDVLREAAASIDRHVDSYEVVARQTIQRLKDTGRSEEDIRQRRRLERRYVRGLLAAADDLYELAEKAEKREPATALEHAQPLLAAGSEVESLEPVESPVIDMGFLSLPAELQAEAERAASEGQERSEEQS